MTGRSRAKPGTPRQAQELDRGLVDTSPSQRHIFVLSADPDSARLLVAPLREAGFAVRHCAAAELLFALLDAASEGAIIIDVAPSAPDGTELVERLARHSPLMATIVVTRFSDVALAVRAMKAGASDLLEQPFGPTLLIETVERALQAQRGAVASRRLAVEAATAAASMGRLSDRERDVIERLAAGMTGKSVAAELGISPRTVEIHRANAMRKTGARSHVALIRIGVLASLAAGGD